MEGIAEAKQAAIEVLLHNARGPFHGLPRTAGWGYPEPYTRDLMIAMLGTAVTGNEHLMAVMRNVLQTLASNQTERGHIPSLVHDPEDRGASDTTPLFLLAVGVYRLTTAERDFLREPVHKALTWMEYQSPSDRYLVAQQPTSDWRDEQWVLGHGLFVNAALYGALRILGQEERADGLGKAICRFATTNGDGQSPLLEGEAIRGKPYFAFWSYKVYTSEHFDLLGNSLAILFGIATPSRAAHMVDWIEEQCERLRRRGELAGDLPPNFFPYVGPGDAEWHARYARFNKPGNYHNGGVWPFICGFYVAALVAAGKHRLAEQKLAALTDLVRLSRTRKLTFGFNEWTRAQTGKPMGQDWQTWSAAMYLYAAKCVEERCTPFFDDMRSK
jgi:hypothetical protein